MDEDWRLILTVLSLIAVVAMVSAMLSVSLRQEEKAGLTVTLSDPPFDPPKGAPGFVQEGRPSFADNRMQVAGGDYGARHVYITFDLEIHDNECNWHTVVENKTVDAVALAREPENVRAEIDAENYTETRIRVKQVEIEIVTPYDNFTVTVQPNETVKFESHIRAQAAEQHQMWVDFRMSDAIRHVGPETGNASVEMANSVGMAHRRKGEEWKEAK